MSSFVAYVYEDDYRQIRELVQHYPNIETGGDLFGLWKDEKTVVIQQFIGPGEKCKRTQTSFHQDIEYLHKVGSLITTEEGLCNVGEWHSHHQIGMPKPSEADRRTVFSNMPHLGLERFVLFIASIEVKDSSGKRPHDVQLDHIHLRPFLFLGSKRKVVEGKIQPIPGSNPHRLNSRAEREIENGKEPPPKYVEEGSGPRKNKNETEKPKNVPKAKPRVETQGRHGESGAEPPAQSSSDHESVGGKPQQRRRLEQDQKTGRNREERENQTQMRDGFNNENLSPNTSSAAHTGRGPQSLPTHFTSQTNIPPQSGTTQAWSRQTTSAPNSLREIRDDSSQFGTAQAHGHGRGIQRNTQSTGGAYSGAQSPGYTQHTSQRSEMDRSYGAQDTSQAQAKDRSGTMPVGNMNRKGFF